MSLLKLFFCAAFALVLLGALLKGAPALTGVVNPASNIPPGLPNYGIAQGAIFVVYGDALGPGSLVQAPSLPLPTTAGLGGTSVTVTVAGITVSAPMIYSSASQVAAVMPSNTPLGTGTVHVTYGGATGSGPVTVIPTNFGISTVNQTGTGPAVVTRPDYSLVTNNNSAKPGDTLVVWGTGLGAVSGGDASAPTPSDLGTPINVFIGGIQAQVLYRGRSVAPGLDQVNIVVPPGISFGCNVSLVFQTNNLVSNTPSLAVMQGGGPCSDMTNQSNIFSTLSGKGTYKVGVFDLVAVPAISMTLATIVFESFTQSAITQIQSSQPSLNSCSVYTSLPPSGPNPGLLNAGAITLTTPSGGSITIPAYLPSPLQQGSYKASNGAGGADVPSFMVSLEVPTAFLWMNPTDAALVDRAQPLKIVWNGGNPEGYVVIQVAGVASAKEVVNVSCYAPLAAGQFTIPSSILLALPPGNGSGANLVSVTGNTALQILTIPSIDLAFFFASNGSRVATTFQ